MSNRIFLLFAGLFLLLIAAQIGILLYQQRQTHLTSLICLATNAGVPLAAADGRVDVYSAGERGKRVTDGSLNEDLTVPAGRYDVRILFTRSRDKQTLWLRDVVLTAGASVTRQVEFSAGELSVDAIVGAQTAKATQVIAYVFASRKHDRLITSMGAGEQVLLAAGAYDVRVVLTEESQEKGVHWLRDVSVQPGLQTRHEVHFRRGRLSIQARNAGIALPPKDVTLIVYRAGDLQEAVLDSGRAGVPLALAVGRYDVMATFSGSHDKPVRWLRGLEVQENATREAEVEFSSGTVSVDAQLKNGGAVGEFQVYVYYYRAGDHQQPVAYTPAGESAILQSGRYDLRANFFRSHDQPNIWLRNMVVKAGRVLRETVTFPTGKLLVRAYDASGTELLGDNVFLYVYSAEQRRRPIATARSGEILILTEGVYDVRAEDTRSPLTEAWLETLQVQAGPLSEAAVIFDDQKTP